MRPPAALALIVLSLVAPQAVIGIGVGAVVLWGITDLAIKVMEGLR